MQKGYDESYYKEYDIGSGTVSYLESPELRKFHASVARQLTGDLRPRTVLDAGCAMGVLVSEFRKLGIDAWGIDYSDYAVANADPLAREHCFQGSLAEEFPRELPRRFDLVTCMEVLEHMSPEDGRRAVANLCAVTDTVIFCSTPDDFEDPTHVNVQEREYWAACFAENGFFDDLNYRPLYMAAYAVCYRRRENWLNQLEDYERYVRVTDQKLADFRDSHYRALEKEHEKAVSEWTRTAKDFTDLQQSYASVNAACAQKTEQLIHSMENCEKLRDQLDAEKEKSAASESARAEAQAELASVKAELTREKAETATVKGELDAAKAETAVMKAEAETARRELTAANGQIESISGMYAALDETNRRCREELNAFAARAEAAEARIAALTSSTSWKATAPFRFVIRSVMRLTGKTFRLLYRTAKRLRRTGSTEPQSTLGERNSLWPPVIEKRGEAGGAKPVAVDCSRALIYTLFDKDGIVDGYVLYFLKELKPWTQRQIVVSNGPLNAEGERALKELGCEILIRENKGFDAWGVKAGIEYVGFEELARYDEVLIANNTLFGPVCSLQPMFETMAERKVDFWGIASHAGMPDFDPFHCNPYGYIPEHIQSFFYAVRGSLIRGEAFRKFWTQLPQLPDYNAAVGLYETVMTRYFSDAGYVWDCYMDSDAYYDMTDNPLIAMPMESIRDWNCPFFKRRAFFQDYDYLTTFTGQQSASCLLQYLQERTQYPVGLVWENLIRTCHMSDLVRNMHLAEIFDRDNEFAPRSTALKAALFLHIYDETMAPELKRYASGMPPAADIYISTTSEEKKAAILTAFGNLPNRVEVRVLPNRGRDVSALLASFKDVVMDYDVACVTHDKKTGYLKPQTVGEGFAYMGYENILASPAFVNQVIAAFEAKPQLGLLYAPDPNHADFATHVGLEWGPNFESTRCLAEQLQLHVPMDEEHPPMAPFGSSFWFRTKAMKPLFDKDWEYDDFPAEPFNATDGSILHAIERIYPYAAQHAGYYSAMLMTADYASVDVGNLYYYAQSYAHASFENGIASRFITVRDICDMRMGRYDALPAAEGTNPPAAPQLPAGQKPGFWKKVRGKLTYWAYE